MSPKRKNLLIITIAIIVASYGLAFYSIINHSEYPSNITRIRTSKYKGNQLTNGASPLDACFGRGYYGGNATLTIKNGASSDAIVCLYSISIGRTIRNEYVRKNSSCVSCKLNTTN